MEKKVSEKIMRLQERAHLIGLDSIRMTTAAGSGHPTSCLSIAQILAVLFFEVMKYEVTDPSALDNDRLILSKGHAAPALYAVFKQLGVLSDEEILQFRSYDSVLEGHPTPRWIYHEAATGSLGQGLALGVGIALVHKQKKRTARTFVILGDSEVAEGSVWEAASLAAKYALNNLIAVLDVNRLGQTGPTAFDHDLQVYADRFAAFGWHVLMVQGHDVAALLETFMRAKEVCDKPVIILAKTFKGHGFVEVENKEDMHGKPFKKEWVYALHIEEEVRKLSYLLMSNVVTKKQSDERALINFSTATIQYQQAVSGPYESTRKAAGLALYALGENSEVIFAIDAEVKNSTYLSFFFDQYQNRSIQCFIAEQAMISIASGVALQKQIPFASTFSAFFMRAADQIRMAGIGKTPIRLIGTHAGISIGQDGPSQMGLEDIAFFRTIPDALILYPSDAHSAFACMYLMANYYDGISYLRATRADTKHVYTAQDIFKIGGSHVLRKPAAASLVIIAAGITLHEALRAADILAKEAIEVSVIDAYSIKPLDVTTIRAIALSSNKRVVVVEDHYQQGGLGEAVMAATYDLGLRIEHLSITTYPRSGSPEELMAHMGIDAHAIVVAAKKLIV